MAVVGAPLVLLDLLNQHGGFHEHLEAELFSRFTDKAAWSLRVLASLNSRRLHLFLPEAEHGIIDATVPLFEQSKFYIYCTDDDSMKNVQGNINYPMFVSIFHVESLLRYLLQTAYACLLDQAELARDEPGKCQALSEDADDILQILLTEHRCHTNYQLGQQAEDRHY